MGMAESDSRQRRVPRKRSAYLLVNTIKWLYLELPVLIGRFAWSNKFKFASLGADFVGFFYIRCSFSLRWAISRPSMRGPKLRRKKRRKVESISAMAQSNKALQLTAR